jgi:hypothetical protein
VSKIAKRERIETETTEPLLDGGYQSRCYEQFAWQCLGCGLVWPRQSFARDCEERGHVTHFESQLYGVSYVENGVPKGNPHTYTRRALRREKPAPEVQTLAMVKAGYDNDDRSFDAWTEYVAALRVPKDTSVVPAWKAQGILPNDSAARADEALAALWAADERAARAPRPADVPPERKEPTMTDNTDNKPPYRGWEAWESFDGWGVANILANGGFNVRGTRLKGGPYNRAQAEDVARRLNAGDPEAFKLLTRRRFV